MLPPYVFQITLISNILVITICFMIIFFTINRSKVFSNISHILHTMIQEYDSGKPPKNKKEFWKIFCDFNNNVKAELDKQITGWKYWIPIGLSIGVAFLMVIVTILIGYGIIHPPIEHVEEPNVIADGTVYRFSEYQSFSVTIQNVGDKATNDLVIEIEFPNNITITGINNNKGTPLDEKTTGGIGESFYFPEYENIKENQTIKFFMLMENNEGDFIHGEDWEIPPSRVQIWTDGNEISISISYN